MNLDHLILHSNDTEESARFYSEVMGFTVEGMDGPFTVLRVSPEFTIQLSPWGTQGGEHLAFAMPRSQFEEILAKVRDRGIAYGDSFESVGNMQGPGEETGARGAGLAVYLFDPNKHLIEIRHYDAD